MSPNSNSCGMNKEIWPTALIRWKWICVNTSESERAAYPNLQKINNNCLSFFDRTVIETLNAVDPERKCFRQIGGVLCERTVKDVLPQLIDNKDFIAKTITKVTEDLSKKGVELNKFKEEHNIKIRGEQIGTDGSKSETESDSQSENRNVLVSN